MIIALFDDVMDYCDSDQVQKQEPRDDCAYGTIDCGELFLLVVSHGNWVSIPIELLDAFLSALARPFIYVTAICWITILHNSVLVCYQLNFITFL